MHLVPSLGDHELDSNHMEMLRYPQAGRTLNPTEEVGVPWYLIKSPLKLFLLCRPSESARNIAAGRHGIQLA